MSPIESIVHQRDESLEVFKVTLLPTFSRLSSSSQQVVRVSPLCKAHCLIFFVDFLIFAIVPVEGVEPSRLIKALGFESSVSAIPPDRQVASRERNPLKFGV